MATNGSWIDALLRAFRPLPTPTPLAAPNGDGIIVPTHDDVKLTAFPGPRRAVRSHAFLDVPSFVGAVADLAHETTSSPEIALSPGDRTVVARFAPGKVDGDDVRLQLTFHPAHEAWLAHFKRPKLSQTEVVELVASFGPMTMDSVAVILPELRKFRVARSGNDDVELNALGYYSYRSTVKNTQVEGRLPTEFSVEMPVFKGISDSPESPHGRSFTFPVMLRLNIADDDEDEDTTFTLTCPTYALVYDEAISEAVRVLNAMLPDGLQVRVGSLGYKAVPALV